MGLDMKSRVRFRGLGLKAGGGVYDERVRPQALLLGVVSAI